MNKPYGVFSSKRPASHNGFLAMLEGIIFQRSDLCAIELDYGRPRIVGLGGH